MGYLLDTCVLSEFTKPRPSAAVERWVSSVPDASQFVSVLTLGELERGVRRLVAGKRRTMLQAWLNEVRARVADRVLPVDLAVASQWAEMVARLEAAGKTVPVIDALIGATAIVHGHSVVTRNGSDIGRTGVTVVDPW
jgi:toxin FitB